jgi:F0F1-type ATP synthase epsilon subunit
VADDTNKFYLKITDPEGLVFGGDVKMFSSKNKVGNFDILPKHTNFISTIAKSLTITKENNTKQQIEFENGIVKVIDGYADVYLGV